MGLLDGTRILEVGTGLPLNAATRVLADLGADVVKVEPHTVGDDARHLPPLVTTDSDKKVRSLMFAYLGRGKRSVAMNPGHPGSGALIGELANASDVVIAHVDSERSSMLRRQLEGTCRLVNISAFPPGPEYGGYQGDDLVPFALSGRMALHGLPGQAPLGYAPFVGDFQLGLSAAAAATVALVTSGPKTLHVSALTAHVGNVDALTTLYEFTGRNSPRGLYESSAVPTSDGYVLIAIGADERFARVCRAIGEPDLYKDERFRTREARVENAESFQSLLLSWSLQRTTREAFGDLQAHGVMAAPILSPEALMVEPHSVVRGSFEQITSGERSAISVPGPILREVPEDRDRHTRVRAPHIGEHSSEVLEEWLSWTEPSIIQAIEDGLVIAQG